MFCAAAGQHRSARKSEEGKKFRRCMVTPSSLEVDADRVEVCCLSR
jgi:hypothetical protein